VASMVCSGPVVARLPPTGGLVSAGPGYVLSGRRLGQVASALKVASLVTGRRSAPSRRPQQRHVRVRPAPPIPVVSPRGSSDPVLGPCRDPFRDRLGGLDVQEVTDVGDDLQRVRGGEPMSGRRPAGGGCSRRRRRGAAAGASRSAEIGGASPQACRVAASPGSTLWARACSPAGARVAPPGELDRARGWATTDARGGR
jgi:hypothetical protein